MSISSKRCSLLVFIALLLVTVTSTAQDRDTKKGQFIALMRAGIVASQIHNDDIGGYNKLGGTVGVGVFTALAEELNLQIEIDYSMRGSRKRPNPKVGDYITYSIEPHYIDVPILLKKYIWKFEFEAGLNNGLFLFSRMKDPNFMVPPGIKDFNRYELGALVGIDLPINQHWHGNARFLYSITPASGHWQFVNGISLLGGAYNNAIMFSLVRVIDPKD